MGDFAMRRLLGTFVVCAFLAACTKSSGGGQGSDGSAPAPDLRSSDLVVLGPDLVGDSGAADLVPAGRDAAAIADSPGDKPSSDGPDAARDATTVSSPDAGRDTTGTQDVFSGGLADSGRDTATDAPVEAGGAGGATGRVSVLQHHNHSSRDGVYVDPALSRTAVAGLHVDPAFPGATISGPTYTQPLYLAGTGGGPDLVIVATEQNHVYAFDASTGGKPVWDQALGTPLPKSRLANLASFCGNIDPLGITGTPVIDPATRTIYLDAMLIASANATAQHQVFALDADTGKVKTGWPVDLNSKAVSGSTTFNSLVENQRGALVLLAGKVFVPFGGHIGDCADFHGWVVGISTEDPTQVSAWATRAIAGGIWAPGGIATDGQSLYFATGNTENQANTFSAPSTWQDGETIFRLPPSLVFSGKSADYFTPTNWAALDAADSDIGGSGPILFDMPGATPSALVIGLGKDGNAYVVDRSNMGGISSPLAVSAVATGNIINAAAAYTTLKGSYVVFKGAGKGCPSGQSGGLAAFKIVPASPPTVAMAWCGGPSTQDSPSVSATDAQGTDALVWIVGSDNKLYALDGDTGKAVFSGGASADTMSAVQKFVTPIIANGRVFVAANARVYAFTP
jgi:outer membrane protein assembly factor BamB